MTIAFSLHLALYVIGAVMLVRALLSSDELLVGLLICCALAEAVGQWLAVLTALTAAFLGEYAIAVFAIAFVLTVRIPIFLSQIDRGRHVDADELKKLIDRVPRPLLEQLSRHSHGGVVDTRAIMEAAGESLPGWPALTDRDNEIEAFDGPVIDSHRGRFTQYFAESVGLALVASDNRNRPLGIARLATAATQIPLSFAERFYQRHGFDPDEAGDGSGIDFFGESREFLRARGGLDLMRRFENGVIAENGVLSEESAEFLSRRSPLELRAIDITFKAAGLIWLVVSAPYELAKWLVGKTKAFGGNRDAKKAARTARKAAAQGESEASTRSGPDWPLLARALWFAVKPGLALGAIAAACLTGDFLWYNMVLVAIVASWRPFRRPYLAAIPAVALWPLSPVASGILLARILVVYAVLWILGAGNSPGGRISAGVQRVVARRRERLTRIAQLKSLELDEAREAFRLNLLDEEAEHDEPALTWIASAIAEARPVETIRACRVVVRGAISGRWSDSQMHKDVGAEMMRLELIEEFLGEGVAKFIGPALAAIAAGVVTGPLEGRLAPGVGFDWLISGLLAFLIALPIARRIPSYFSAALWCFVAYLVVGIDFWKLSACALAGGLLSVSLREYFERLLVRGRKRWRSWPVPRSARPEYRMRWRAANTASLEGRPALAAQILLDLAEMAGGSRHRPNRELASTAVGAAALLEIDRGNLRAAELAVLELDRIGESSSAVSELVRGSVDLEFGQFEESSARLRRVVEEVDARSPIARQAVFALARAEAASGRPEQALTTLTDLPVQGFALRGLAAMIEEEIAIARAVASLGDLADARRRLDDLDGWIDSDVLPAVPDQRKRMLTIEAERKLLSAELALRAGKSGDALGHLDVIDSSIRDELDDRGVDARVDLLGGVARSDPALIKRGIQVLELRRRQVRGGDRRASMVASGDILYTLALDALAQLQRVADGPAGQVAAGIVESLRRSAILEMIRSGAAMDDARLMNLGAAIESGSESAEDSEMLQQELRKAFSDTAAAAYLPDEEFEVGVSRIFRDCHMLTYYVSPGGERAWRVWTAPDGKTRIDAVDLGEELERRLASAASGYGFADDLIHRPRYEDAEEWESWARVLLPKKLYERLSECSEDRPESLLIVPDGPLSLVPWAALHIAGEPIIKRAALQLAPAMELLGTGREQKGGTVGAVLAHADAEGPEATALAEVADVVLASTRAEFVSRLDARGLEGAYVAAHGRENGFRQNIEFEDGSELSAAAALTHSWPSWVMFASCLVGRIENSAGREPLGIAVSCMLGGAQSVVASVLEITDDGATKVCPVVAASLAAGEHPALALRRAQLDYLARDTMELATPASCLGLVCISTLPPVAAGEMMGYG